MQNLLDSEEVLKSSSCSRALFLKTYFLAVGLAVAGVYLLRIGSALIGDSWNPTYSYLLFGLSAIIFLTNELRSKSEKLYVTNRRIVFEEGLFSKSYESLPYTRISDTVLEESLSERLFGIGDLIVNTPGSQLYALRARGLPDCEQIQNEIEARMEATSGEGVTAGTGGNATGGGEDFEAGYGAGSAGQDQRGGQTGLNKDEGGERRKSSASPEQATVNGGNQERRRRVSNLENELSRVNSRLKELEERYEGYDLEKSKYRRMKDSLEARKESIQDKLSRLRS